MVPDVHVWCGRCRRAQFDQGFACRGCYGLLGPPPTLPHCRHRDARLDDSALARLYERYVAATSMRDLARELAAAGVYGSPGSAQVALSCSWRRLGWPTRGRGRIRQPRQRLLTRMPAPGEGTPYELALNILRRRKAA